MEIERKFLIKELPNIEPVKHTRIYSGYISIEPEVRIRSSQVIAGEDEGHVDYLLTIKGNGDLVREEIETYVTKEFFEKVRDFINKPLIEKDFRKYYVDGHVVECNIVDGGHFMYGEVEFNTKEEAKAFKWPFGEAEDVTYNKFYKMKNYWSRTRQQQLGGIQ